jgi:hypothetical protein
VKKKKKRALLEAMQLEKENAQKVAFWRVAITLCVLYIGSYNFFIEYANYEKGKNAFKQTVFQLDRETLNLGKDEVLRIMKEKTPWYTEFAPWEYGSYSVGMDKEDRQFGWWRNTLIFPAVGVGIMSLIFWMCTGIYPID